MCDSPRRIYLLSVCELQKLIHRGWHSDLDRERLKEKHKIEHL